MNSSLLKVVVREFHRIAERRTLYILMIFLPICLAAVLGIIYRNGVLHDIPVAIYDMDNSEISRLLIRSIDATASMEVIASYNSEGQIKSEFLKGNIQGALYIPDNFESDLKSGKSPFVGIYKNTSNLIIGNSIYKDAITIVRTISGGALLKKLRSRGLQQEKAMNIINPIRIDTISLFNPAYNYFNFLIPGLLTALLQMIIMVSAVLIISSEFTHNTFGELLDLCKSNIFVLVTGKSIPHILIHLSTAISFLGIVFPLFGLEATYSIYSTLLMLIIFISASFFIGLFISSFFHEQLFATELALFINTPAFIFSGFTFPLWGMPALHNCFAQLIPFTHFLSGFIKVFYMNAPLRFAYNDLLILAVFSTVGIIGTFISLWHQINLYRNMKRQELLSNG